MWKNYCDPGKRHLAMSIEPDELGHWWLVNRWLGRQVSYAWISTPEDGFKGMSSGIERARQGLPSEVNSETDLPVDYWDPSARVRKLDDFGIDHTIILPHWGCVFSNVPRGVADHLDVVRANLEATNRRAVDIQSEGAGRLLAIGQVNLRGGDQTWLEEQLRLLAAGGVKAAMLSYGLQDGRPLSTPIMTGPGRHLSRTESSPSFMCKTTAATVPCPRSGSKRIMIPLPACWRCPSSRWGSGWRWAI